MTAAPPSPPPPLPQSDSFSVDWLALREPADLRAQNMGLVAALCAALPQTRPVTRPVRIVDLGCGTGASVRALAPHLPPQQSWLLVDKAAPSLEAAQRRLEGWAAQHPALSLTIETRQADLALDLDVPEGTDVVVTSALLDLASAAWIERLVAAIQAVGAALLDRLSVTAEHLFTPQDADDAAIVEAFHRDQRRDKGLGLATGPDAPAVLREAALARGVQVRQADSAWGLRVPGDAALMAALVDLYARVAMDQGLEAQRVSDWAARRRRHTQSLTVGHTDTLLLP